MSIDRQFMGHATAYGYAVSKGYTGTEEEFAELMASYGEVAQDAEQSAENAEAYAVGQRNGADVESDDPAYHNNSKYYSEQSGSSASAAAISAGLAEDSAAIAVEAAENFEKVYGARWDRTTNLLTRLFGAKDITTDTSNFKHSGSFNAALSNPFDLIYPWSDIVVCNVDLTAYRARTGTESLRNFITAVYGDPDFTYEGSQTNLVAQYVPEFWYKSEEDSAGRVTYFVSTSERVGYKHHEEAFCGISFAIDAGLDGSNNRLITCGQGVPFTNVAGSTLHTYAKNSGFTLMNADEVDAITCLYLVEYANWNSQAALGDGCSNCYRENATDAIANVDNTGDATVFDVTDSALSSLIYVGTQVDFGASAGATTYKGVVASFTVNSNTYTITLDRKLEDLTNGMIMSVHGFDACEFPLLGQSVGSGSGYIGTNGKANAWYRGAVLYANRYQYILGMYRQQNTNHLWICPEGEDPDDYDALDTSKHQDTGCALPDVSAGWLTVGGNAQRIAGMAAWMAAGTSSGSSSSPVGDQQYVPAKSSGATVLWLGCGANYDWYCGVLGCTWNGDAGYSYWNAAARPLLKKSL